MNSLRFFWLAVFAVFIGIASYLAEEIFFPIRLFPQGTIEYQIHEDFHKLKDLNQLPKELQNIHEVFIRDQRIQKATLDWQTLSTHDFPQDKSGQYDLQIEIFDAPESPKDTFQIIQYSLFDKDTKNKIWELSRQYSPYSQSR